MFTCDQCRLPAVACCICDFPLPFVCDAHLEEHPDSSRLTHFHLPLYARRTISSQALRKTWKTQLLALDTHRLQVAGDFQTIASAYRSAFSDLQKKVRSLTAEKDELSSKLDEQKKATAVAQASLKEAHREVESVKKHCSDLEQYLTHNTQIQLKVQCSRGTEQTIYPLVSATISEVKAAIQRLLGIAAENQRIFLGAKELEDERTIDSLRLLSGTVLILRQVFQVFVKSARSLSVDVVDSEFISSLKLRIQQREKIPAEWQSLSYRGRLLQDQDTVSSCGISKGVTLHLAVRMPAKTITQMLFIHSKTGKVFTVDFNGEEMVEALKARVCKACKLTTTIVLKAGGDTLKDGVTVADSGVSGGAYLSMSAEIPQEHKSTDEEGLS